MRAPPSQRCTHPVQWPGSSRGLRERPEPASHQLWTIHVGPGTPQVWGPHIGLAAPPARAMCLLATGLSSPSRPDFGCLPLTPPQAKSGLTALLQGGLPMFSIKVAPADPGSSCVVCPYSLVGGKRASREGSVPATRPLVAVASPGCTHGAAGLPFLCKQPFTGGSRDTAWPPTASPAGNTPAICMKTGPAPCPQRCACIKSPGDPAPSATGCV